MKEYLNSPAVSDKVKAGLERLVDFNRQLAEAAKETSDLTRKLTALNADQARLRENLRIIPATADPYKKFLDKFVSQETDIEGLQRQIRNVEARAATLERDFDDFLRSWTAD